MNREQWVKSLEVGDKVIHIQSPDNCNALIGVVKSISLTKLCVQLPENNRGIFFDKDTGTRSGTNGSWIQPYRDF